MSGGSWQRANGAADRHMRAWLLLVGALALHVLDEATTGFLDFYNPLVISIRSRVWWFPLPTFDFDAWIVGLIVLVVVLAALGLSAAAAVYVGFDVFVGGFIFAEGGGQPRAGS